MYLFFDTETSGMIDRGLPVEHPSQPRVVQYAAILTDEELNVQSEVAILIQPDGAQFEAGAVRVHGISEERAQRYGVPMVVALSTFAWLCRSAKVAVAHNIEFDAAVMETQFRRIGKRSPIELLKQECTMMLAEPICQIPNFRGDGLKPPSLAEAHQHFLGEGFENAHDALADTRACIRVYRAIRNPGQHGTQQDLFDKGSGAEEARAATA